jgi:Arc/MetJ-type ribon-helix-helix transcriptional regulator
MTIEITNPEDEKIIRTKLQNGEFRSVDELIHYALISLPTPAQPNPARPEGKKSLAQLFAESPFRGLDIEFERLPGTLRSTDL